MSTRAALLVLIAAALLNLGLNPALGATAPTSPVSWYSTGDSYSSGEGVPGNAGACAQTRGAWGPATAKLLSAEGWQVPKTVFTACTGHLVGDQYIARAGAAKGSLWDWAKEQGAPATPSIDVVTLSFGGNNIDFASVLTDCLNGLPGDWSKESLLFDDCDITENQLRARVEALTKPDALRFDTKSRGNRPEKVIGSLADFYILVAQRHLSERGRLVVMGYPRLFSPSNEWGLWQGTRCNGVTRGDANMLGRIAELLDTVIHSQVTKANKTLGVREKILYISALDLFGGREAARAGKLADRHELCGPGEDWLNGEIAPANHLANEGDEYMLARKESGFHPHEKGHAAEARQVAATLSSKGLISEALRGKETGRIAFTHPTWGPSHLITTLDGGPQGTARIYVVDAAGTIRWQHGIEGADEISPNDPGKDKTGHLFVNWNPGRYPGVIVLGPIANGMADYASLPDKDGRDYDTRFYSGASVDHEPDGVFEIDVEENSCKPDCAGGQKSTTTFAWKTGDYRAVSRTSALRELKVFLEAWRRADRPTMRKFASDTVINSFEGGDGRDSTYQPPPADCNYEVSWGQCEIVIDPHGQGGYGLIYGFVFDMPNGHLQVSEIKFEGDTA